MLVNAFVFNQVDYKMQSIGKTPKGCHGQFQQVPNAAAPISINSLKYDQGLTYARKHELQWLDIHERIQFRTAVTVHCCLNGLASVYLSELRCTFS